MRTSKPIAGTKPQKWLHIHTVHIITPCLVPGVNLDHRTEYELHSPAVLLWFPRVMSAL